MVLQFLISLTFNVLKFLFIFTVTVYSPYFKINLTFLSFTCRSCILEWLCSSYHFFYQGPNW